MPTVAVLPRQPRRLGPKGAALLDLAVVGGIGFLALVGGLGLASVVALALGVLQTVPLLWRRRYPVGTFAAVAAASALQVPTYGEPLVSQLAFPVAVYSVARFSSAAMGYVALGTGLVASVVAALDWTSTYSAGGGAARSYAVTIGLIVLAAWALGTLGRTRAAYVDALLAHTQHLARDAEQRAELAASDERARIAREMHDVVAHGLSVIVVQADGARYAAAKDPDVATRTLETIAATGREALTEMRRLLGLLRSDDTGTAPQPGLADLPYLLDQAAADGLPIVANLPDPAPAVPDGTALVVYRVVQEALTNVRRHAGPVGTVEVVVAEAPGEIVVRVTDDGRGAAATPGRDASTGGLGLVGMRERVRAAGGSVTTGPRPGGGFEVGARIPV